jgi:signal transduction histidine kinase
VNPWERSWRTFSERDFQRFADRVEITYLNDLPFPELLQQLGQLPANSAVIYAELLRDAGGHVFVPARVCPLIASAANAPVYGLYDTYLGSGIVGGVIIDYTDLARQTARLGLQVLERGTASGLPVESAATRVEVDWRQLQRWKIDERRLPTGSVLLFRTPTLWERYKWYLLAGIAAILAQFVFIIGLVREIRRRKKSDMAVRNLSGRLIHAGEEERKLVARELHDDIGQRLSLLSLDLDQVDQGLPTNGSKAHGALKELLDEIITDVHDLSHHLHSSKLQNLGLEATLDDLCREFTTRYEREITYNAQSVPIHLGEDLSLCFYRVAQEALHNSVKHSGAARIEVSLAAHNGSLQMTVKDYGVGFDPSVSTNGIGLATMQERMRFVGGNLFVNSRPGEGTEVTALAPLQLFSHPRAAA